MFPLWSAHVDQGGTVEVFDSLLYSIRSESVRNWTSKLKVAYIRYKQIQMQTLPMIEYLEIIMDGREGRVRYSGAGKLHLLEFSIEHYAAGDSGDTW